MVNATYSGDMLTDKDIDRYVSARLDAICADCPARQIPDIYDLCARCPMTDVHLMESAPSDRPRDTRDYLVR